MFISRGEIHQKILNIILKQQTVFGKVRNRISSWTLKFIDIDMLLFLIQHNKWHIDPYNEQFKIQGCERPFHIIFSNIFILSVHKGISITSISPPPPTTN